MQSFEDLQHREIVVSACDPIDWLSSQPLYPKVYWRDRNCSTEHAAVGELLHFSELPSLDDQDAKIRIYGGMSFTGNGGDSLWKGFDAQRFWLPQCELVCNEEKTECIAHSLDNSFYAPHPALDIATTLSSALVQRKDLPEKREWKSILEKILEAIEHRHLEKVVCARKTELQLRDPISVWTLLKRLRSRSVNTTLFAFEIAPGLCFFGSTPEKLFERQGTQFFTEAVAGTRGRAHAPLEDEQIAKELLCNPKDKNEFSIVKQFLENKLSQHVENASWEGKDHILQNAHVQHIYNRLFGTLRPAVSDVELIQSLHPTPALGGVPSATALEMIAQHEPFDRGWYGAPVGMISSQRSSFAVAIRSALLREKSFHLFAGTGIVKGSLPNNEWDELEQKIHPIISLLED